MLNLSHNYCEKDHIYYPTCEQSVQIQEYRHIRGCYEFHTISKNISKKNSPTKASLWNFTS